MCTKLGSPAPARVNSSLLAGERGFVGGVVDRDEAHLCLRSDADVIASVELLPLADDVARAPFVLLGRRLDQQDAVQDQKETADRLAGLDEHVPLGELELAPDVEELRDEVLVDG
jgi:hypothetical protein